MISMKNICDYAGTNPGQRKFIEGERVYKAKFIIKCGKNEEFKDSDKVSFITVCSQTSAIKDKNPHQINREISKSGDIVQCSCTCKAGLGEKCKHIIAALLYIYEKGDNLEVLSCTDKKCEWRQDHSKALEVYDTAPLMQHSCFFEPVKTKKIINPSLIKDCYEQDECVKDADEEAEDEVEDEAAKETKEIVTALTNQSSLNTSEIVAVKKKRKITPDVQVSQSQLQEIISFIRKELPMSTLSKHELGRHEPLTFKEKSKVTETEKKVICKIFEGQDSDLMRSIQEFEVPVVEECCLKTIDQLRHNLQSVCENTKDHYAHWMRERQNRITGSICYGLFTYTKSKRTEDEWKKNLTAHLHPKTSKQRLWNMATSVKVK